MTTGVGASDGSATAGGVGASTAETAAAADGVSAAAGTGRWGQPAGANGNGRASAGATSPVKYTVSMSQTVRVKSAKPLAAPSVSLTQATHVSFSAAQTWRWGRAIHEAMKVKATSTPNIHYSITLSQVVKIATALLKSLPVTLSQNMTVHQAQSVALGVMLLTRLRVGETSAPATTYHGALAQAIAASSALQAFFGRGFAQSLHVHDGLSASYVGVVSSSQNMQIASVLGSSFLLSATMTQAVDIGGSQLLRMIFSGEGLAETIDLAALYVSPSGSTTTWAINTRTNAITEYQNWAFNSFARMGRKYIAADENGIYELDGERDDGENIVSILRGGMMQMNASRLSGLKGVYLGMRTDTGGDFILMIEAGDGREYVYALTANPNQMTTKVEIGKGLRSRYFAFELQGLGADYDLDNIEFVPLLPQRRV